MSNYTPDELAVRGAYNYARGSSADSDAGLDSEFGRFIAKVKADALREAAEATSSEAAEEPYAGASFTTYADWLEERADRIEREVGL